MREEIENNDSDIAVEITGLWKNYKMFNRKRDRLLETVIPKINRHTEFSAIKDFNLTIKKGDSIGILGKNGAGKSTLLKMITGVVTPSKGDIKVNGKISSLLELGAAFNVELTRNRKYLSTWPSNGLHKTRDGHEKTGNN